MAVQGEHASDTRLSPLRRGAFWWRVLAELLRQAALFLVGFLLLTLPPWDPAPRNDASPAPAGRPDPRESKPAIPDRPDLRRLQQALDNGDDPAVLDFFRKLTLSDKERSDIAALIARFGNESFEVREQAARDVIAWGPRSAGVLRRATRSADPETAARARYCLREVLKDASSSRLVRAAEYVTRHQLAGAAVVLLAYLPDAEDEAVAAAVRSALVRVASERGTVVEAVVRALDDPLPERRAAAGIALCKSDSSRSKYQKAVDRLLNDPVPEVRRDIAFTLIESGERKGLPVWIGLLDVLPPDQAWAIVDLLSAIAGAGAPAVAPGNDVAGRRRCRDAWSAWYREHGAKADLTPAVLPAPAGGALVVLLNPRNQEGSVAQLRPDETSIWQIEGLEYPLYAEEIAGKRVLIAEYEGERITERNFHGEIQWSKELGRPVLSAHRLPSGNTFVVHRNRVVELDRDGKEVFAHSRAVRDIAAARRLPDGQVVLLTDTGDCVFLDANGQEVHRFSTGARQVLGAGLDVLPNRRVLVPHFTENKVIEYGPTGEVLWQAQVRSPTSVHRLPGGITLVASTETREVLEIDRTGKELWKHTVPAPARPVCALGR